MRGTEKKVLLSMLDDLILHFEKTDNRSLLARIYGLFTIKTNVFKSVNVIIMQNTVILTNKAKPRMSFDLKGSSAGRYTTFSKTEHNWWLNMKLGHKKVMKDNNFREINNDFNNQLLKFTGEQKRIYDEIIFADSMFLSKKNLIDYSLLLVVEQE